MRHTIAVLAIVTVALALALARWPHQATDPDLAPSSPLEPGDWLLQRRLSGDPVDEAQLARATRAAAELRARTVERAPGVAQATWQFLGPDNIGGRVLDVVIDPLDAATLYVATASGGLMKSTDGGQTLASAWPDENAQAIGALAISPGGRLYAGVGEGGPNGSSPTLGNKGVFVSDDGAATWTLLGLTGSARIGRIVIDPSDDNRLFVAATGPVFAPGGERGVYRSTDAGQTWQLVLAGANDTTGATDIAIDPQDPNRIYAVMWDHLRQASFRRLGGTGSGVFQSDDGGDSWTRLEAGLPVAGPGIGRIGITVAASDANRLYAIVVDNVGYFHSFYRSTDRGASWQALPAPSPLIESQSSFGWWFGRVWVDPDNAEHVYVAGIPLMRSLDGGTTWSAHFDFHVDQHAMAWDQLNAGRVYIGNDGGVYRSDSGATSSVWIPATVQPYTQSYSVAVSTQDPTRLLTGTQDNRCLRSYTGSGAQFWNAFGCSDGLEVEIDYSDHNTLYACSQRGFCSRSFDGGESVTSITNSSLFDRAAWQAPLEIDPTTPNVLYFAGNRVLRSINWGENWTTISGDLTGNFDPDPNDNYVYGTITALGVAKTDPNVIYAGTDDARVWYTTDLGANWTQVTDPDMPDRWVTAILVDPNDANRAFVSYSGYHVGDSTPYILVTTDGGTGFDDITANLPQAPVNTMAMGPTGEIIAGTDLGIYASYDNGSNWQALGSGLPSSPVMAVRVHEPSSQLFAATFGRGIWSVSLPLLDADEDGLADPHDNCTVTANASQLDTDADGFGNVCDADFNNDCIVNVIDLGYLKSVFFSADPLADLTMDGVVNVADLARFKQLFLAPPGPSGLIGDCST